jgi:hypothetical protein
MGGLAAKRLLLIAGMAGFVPLIAMAQPVQPLPKQTLPVPLDAPSIRIGNGLLDARVYLIDPAGGFYRGTRFDQAGVIGSLTLGQQDFYGPWFDRVSDEVMDFTFTPDGIVAGPDSAVSGPVDEFAPIGFEDAAPGGTFLKIGVGLLRKPDARSYDHYRVYDIVDPGKRDTRTTRNSITFLQDIAGVIRYEKILRLLPGKPVMQIEHILTNTGSKPISTTVYDHNFLKLAPGNENVAAEFVFPITPDKMPDPEMVGIDGNRFAYRRALTGKESTAFHITGFGNTDRDYDIHVENAKTGAAVRVTADQPIIRLNIWSIRSVMAVEPYIDIAFAPGEVKRWTYTYQYQAPAR